MGDVYRTAAERDPPRCMFCPTQRMVFDVMWAHWLCIECGWCDCGWPAEQASEDPKR